MPRVFLHIDVLSWLRGASRGEPRQRAKCLEHLRQLAASGETPFKTTEGNNRGWRRSQLFGNRFYLWWAPCGAMRQIAERVRPHSGDKLACDALDAYVRTVTYHDDTKTPILPDAHRPELWSELTAELFEQISAPVNQPGRSGPRVGRGRVQAGDEEIDLAAIRAARENLRPRRKLQQIISQTRRSIERLSALGGAQPAPVPPPPAIELPGAPESAPAPPEPEPPTDLTSPADAVPTERRAGQKSANTESEPAPAEVQQALLDLYGSKLSQKEAARRIGISQPTFNQWVSGRRGVGKRYWPKILNAAATLRPQSPPPGSRKRRQKADKRVMPNDVQDALLDLLTSKVVARAEIARRIGVSSQTLAQWVDGGAVAEFYWPLIVIVANKVRAEQREADEFARALGVLGERHGAENLPKLIGVRQETLADYYKYGVLPARAKVLRAIELAK
jgi:DNA-binding transcriptional regulator YdaS (Cro superfamily)